jgi:hypothetical protein
MRARTSPENSNARLEAEAPTVMSLTARTGSCGAGALLQAAKVATHTTSPQARIQERFDVEKVENMANSIVNDSLVSNVADLA